MLGLNFLFYEDVYGGKQLKTVLRFQPRYYMTYGRGQFLRGTHFVGVFIRQYFFEIGPVLFLPIGLVHLVVFHTT